MSKDDIRENIIEFKKSDSDVGPMMCPYRTETLSYLDKSTNVSHQVTYFVECYQERCMFFKNKVCRKVEYDIKN